MSEQICYVVMSQICDNELKLNGIFTSEYLKEHAVEISEMRRELKKKCDFEKCYIIPLNHFIEKGMVL